LIFVELDARVLDAMRQGSMGLRDEVSTSDSNLARVIFIVRCLGPLWSP